MVNRGGYRGRGRGGGGLVTFLSLFYKSFPFLACGLGFLGIVTGGGVGWYWLFFLSLFWLFVKLVFFGRSRYG